jgi:hypothetical protein
MPSVVVFQPERVMGVTEGPVILSEVLKLPAVGLPVFVVLPIRPMVASKEPLVTRLACAEKASVNKAMAEKPMLADLCKFSFLFTCFSTKVLAALGRVSEELHSAFVRVTRSHESGGSETVARLRSTEVESKCDQLSLPVSTGHASARTLRRQDNAHGLEQNSQIKQQAAVLDVVQIVVELSRSLG